MLQIVPIYAAILTLFYVALSMRTIRQRAKHKITIGDLGNQELARAIRAHSNFIEYTPLALILFSMIELNGGSPKLVHGLCIAFLLARVTHALTISQINEPFKYRKLGMILTFTSLITAALYLFFSVI